MKLSKRLGSVILAVAMLASSMSAFACANDQFIAYDQIPDALGNYAKLYFCPEKDTVVANGIAQTAEWKPVFFEAEYPHREIEALFLDGINTGMTRYMGKNAEVNVKEVPEFWEAKTPYFVYNRLYSDFTGTFKPTNTLKTDCKSAPIEKEWIYKGFENYVVENGVVKDYSLVYANNADKVNISYNLDRLAKEYQAKIDAGVSYEEASKIFVDGIEKVEWLELTGPDYATGGKYSFVPFEKIVAGADASWYDNDLVKNPVQHYGNADLNITYPSVKADVEWVTIGYELEAPYRYYQVLSVDGVLMDGSEVELVGSTVIEEEKVGEVEDYSTKIQLIKKGTDLVNSTTTITNDYVFSACNETTKKYTTVAVDDEFKVSNDPEREVVVNSIATLAGAEYEVRIVKEKAVPGKAKLPYIYRYQGNANPKVTWEVAFAEAAFPYEIYEEKFVDGIATGEYRTTGKYAEPKVTLDQTMSQPRVLTVMLQDTTDRTKLAWALEDAGFNYIIRGDRVNVIVTGEIYAGHNNYDNIANDVSELVYKYSATVTE